MKRIVLLLLLGSPSLLAAQTTTLSSFVAADGGVRGSPVLLGATVARETGPVGLRWNAAVDAASSLGMEAAPEKRPRGLLVTEMDALLLPTALVGDLPVVPYALAGVGARWIRDQGAAEAGLVWSYGGGARVPLAGRIQMEAEARHRQPLGTAAEGMPSGTTPGWEYRFGLNVRFGRLAAPLPRPAAPPRPLPVPVPVAGESEAETRLRIARRAIDTADDFLGVHYLWGGNTPEQGFDCSGFVRYVFGMHGVALPRVSRDQARAGAALPLDLAALEPGDLLAFASDGREVDHIAIYAGEGRIIHSSASGRGVRYDDLNSQRGRWYREHLVAARRILQSPWSWGE